MEWNGMKWNGMDRWMVGFSPRHHRVARGTVRLVSWETRQLRARQVRSAQWDWSLDIAAPENM